MITASRFPTARQTEAARKAEAAVGAPPLPSGDQKLYHVKQVCQFPCLRRKDARWAMAPPRAPQVLKPAGLRLYL